MKKITKFVSYENMLKRKEELKKKEIKKDTKKTTKDTKKTK